MTPIQLVKAHCDCYENGTCLGITIRDGDYSLVRFRKEGSGCLLAESPIKRCRHFEQCIMPIKLEHKDARAQARLQAEFANGIHDYKIRTGAMDSSNIRLCPKCQTNKIAKGRKLCDRCKAENRRETQRQSNQTRNAESDYNSSLGNQS